MVKKKSRSRKLKMPKLKLPKIKIKKILLDENKAKYLAKVIAIIILILFTAAIMMQLGYIQ